MLKFLYPNSISRIKTNKPELYLTFDDGPFPDITIEVLKILKSYHAKATFFCQGIQAQKYPEIMNCIRQDGHTIGNHGFLHLDGFKTLKKRYIENILKGSRITKSQLYRPPYGRIWPWQYFFISKINITTFWDVMAHDFSKNYTPQQCFNHIVKQAKPGSIIVLHDAPWAWHNLPGLLPKLLEYYAVKGYQFKSLSLQNIRL
jgi:peptidoglycan/xylan/chitin deacetylase (PgdA/CDA1 family)